MKHGQLTLIKTRRSISASSIIAVVNISVNGHLKKEFGKTSDGIRTILYRVSKAIDLEKKQQSRGTHLS